MAVYKILCSYPHKAFFKALPTLSRLALSLAFSWSYSLLYRLEFEFGRLLLRVARYTISQQNINVKNASIYY